MYFKWIVLEKPLTLKKLVFISTWLNKPIYYLEASTWNYVCWSETKTLTILCPDKTNNAMYLNSLESKFWMPINRAKKFWSESSMNVLCSLFFKTLFFCCCLLQIYHNQISCKRLPTIKSFQIVCRLLFCLFFANLLKWKTLKKP